MFRIYTSDGTSRTKSARWLDPERLPRREIIVSYALISTPSNYGGGQGVRGSEHDGGRVRGDALFGYRGAAPLGSSVGGARLPSRSRVYCENVQAGSRNSRTVAGISTSLLQREKENRSIEGRLSRCCAGAPHGLRGTGNEGKRIGWDTRHTYISYPSHRLEDRSAPRRSCDTSVGMTRVDGGTLGGNERSEPWVLDVGRATEVDQLD